MDLILCRNLLIYFTPAHARQLIGNLRQSLVDDGWLVVSPSECSQALFSGFVPVNFPGSILYRRGQKRDAERAIVAEPLNPAASATEPLSGLEMSALLAPPPKPLAATLAPDIADWAGEFSAAESAYSRGDYGDTSMRLRALLPAAGPPARQLRVLALLARSLANQGALEEALAVSEQWLATDKLDAAAHYLNAMVLQELGERTRARAALNNAVYLQPDFTLAHFALGNHARAEARVAEARRHFDNAARLLSGLAAAEVVPESDGLTAGRLREIILSLSRDP
jgi:chemotaxis protein methyltransferase CheR